MEQQNEPSDPGQDATRQQVRQQQDTQERGPAAAWALGLLGAAGGGALGTWLFLAIAREGFYALVLPGALIGLGCGLLARRKSQALGIVCGLLGLAAGILSEWLFAPFIRDKSLPYFLAHLHELRVFTIAMILLGGFLAYWFGHGRGRDLPLPRPPRPADDTPDA